MHAGGRTRREGRRPLFHGGEQHSPEPVVKQIHAERAWAFSLAEGLESDWQGWSRQMGPYMKLLTYST